MMIIAAGGMPKDDHELVLVAAYADLDSARDDFSNWSAASSTVWGAWGGAGRQGRRRPI